MAPQINASCLNRYNFRRLRLSSSYFQHFELTHYSMVNTFWGLALVLCQPSILAGVIKLFQFLFVGTGVLSLLVYSVH